MTTTQQAPDVQARAFSAPPKDFDPKTFNPKDPEQAWQKGDHIQGVSKEGIETVLEEAGPALKKLSAELDDLQEATAKLKNGVLGEEAIVPPDQHRHRT